MRLPTLLLLAAFALLTACAHTYYQPTGLPSDVGDRFYFHVDHEAQALGLRTARDEEGVTVYADVGYISYAADGDEIVATLVVPNKSNVTGNYYRNHRDNLRALNDELVAGARQRAREARDFAY